jgi:ATP-dependent RNA helicase DeaD
MEICEIQLYHLVNKIKETEVNADVESYLPAINEMLEGIDKETLIQKIVSVEFGRFFNYYNKARDLNSSDKRERGERREEGGSKNYSGDGSVRYFINIGEKDGYDWMSLKDFLRDTVNLGKDDIFKVDVKDSFAFFNSESHTQEAILNTFKDLKVDGRFVNVEVSNNPIGGGGGHRGGSGKFKGGRGRSVGGGYKGKESRGSKGFGSSKGGRDRSETKGGRSRDGGKSYGSSPFSEKKKSKRRNGFM